LLYAIVTVLQNMPAVVALGYSLTAQLILSFIFVIYQSNPMIAFWLVSSASGIAILIPFREETPNHKCIRKPFEGPIICNLSVNHSALLHTFRLLLLGFGLSSVDNLIPFISSQFWGRILSYKSYKNRTPCLPVSYISLGTAAVIFRGVNDGL